MKVPKMFYGRAGAAKSRARKATKGLSATLDFDSFDPGDFVDTATLPGALMLSSERHQEPGEHFHCYVLSVAVEERCDVDELLEVMTKWMRWSFEELWRFTGVLGTDTTFVLSRNPELRRPYVKAAAKYWEELNAEGRRYGPFIDEPGSVCEQWWNLSFTIANLGVPNDEVLPAMEAGPTEFLRRIEKEPGQ
jgi:hypothetical protein